MIEKGFVDTCSYHLQVVLSHLLRKPNVKKVRSYLEVVPQFEELKQVRSERNSATPVTEKVKWPIEQS